MIERQTLLDKASKFIRELRGLVASESYSEALAKFNREGIEILVSLPPSTLRKELILLAAGINTSNHRKEEACIYMDQLMDEYPDVEEDFDYIIQKLKLILLHCDYDACSSFLARCQKIDLSERQSNQLKHFAGMVAFWQGDYFNANRLFEECHDLGQSFNDDFICACSSFMLGYVAFQRCFFDIAEANYRKALERFDKCEKYVSKGHTYKMLAILAYRTGKYDKAEELLQPAIKFFKLTGHGRNNINLNLALGRIEFYRGNYEASETRLLDSLEKASNSGFRREMALSFEFLGELCYHQERYDESLSWMKEAEKIAMEIAPEGDIAVETFRRLSEIYVALGRIEDAEIALSKAQRLCASMNDKYELGCVLRTYGTIAYKKNDMDLAMSFFNEAVVTLKLINGSFELGITLQTIAETCEKWIRENETDTLTHNELLEKARDNAVEALHLFSSTNLEDRAEICRDLVHRLEGKINSSVPGLAYQKIRFNKKWLIEDGIIAASDSMTDVISRVRKLARGKMPVTVTGETGTGKEIIAGLLHKFSGRADGPFIPVNCAAIPETIFDSEFFGYRKGAFTGATNDKAGLFEEASGGTLFLDEITELTVRQQAKLLRALQEQCVRRVGETKERPVDVRLVSASNQDIWSLVESGKLREDFYYRIAGGIIELEPLRKRKDDILPLFSYYLCGPDGEFNVEEGLPELLLQHHWPGNVRELINITEELAMLGESGRIVRKQDLPIIVRNFLLSEPRDEEEMRRQIEACLRKNDGNKTAVARELGIGRSTLYRRLIELQIT